MELKVYEITNLIAAIKIKYPELRIGQIIELVTNETNNEVFYIKDNTLYNNLNKVLEEGFKNEIRN